MNKIVSLFLSMFVIFILVSLIFKMENRSNERPEIFIDYPKRMEKVSGILTIIGRAYDKDGDIRGVEVRIDNSSWISTDGYENWSYSIDTRALDNGYHTIYARSWDGNEYSHIEKVTFEVYNQIGKEMHKWALFVAAANPTSVEIKLGNGMLSLSEEMARYFISNLNYPANHITILFDDGWIRSDNGRGKRIMTLQQREDKIEGASYGPATKEELISVIESIEKDANRYNDSEVFIWISGHGVGNPKKITGGKILERSEMVLWDGIISDRDLGDALRDLDAKLCLVVDSCFSGEFANRLIFNIPSLLKSGIPKDGRIVITGESKFSIGYASNISGPLFTQLWFYGLESGKADGFKKGLLNSGRKTHLNIFKDGKVSVEEAFYYARYMIRREYRNYVWMQPQMNDMYPHMYPYNRGEMFLGD